MDLTSDQIVALQSAVGDAAARIAARMGLPNKRVSQFLDRLAYFIIETRATMRCSFAIQAVFDASGTVALTEAYIRASSSAQLSLFSVDAELKIVSSSHAALTALAIGDRSAQDTHLYFLVEPQGRALAFICGRVESELLLNQFGGSNHASWARPVREFPQILEDHFANAVAREQQVKYWHEKSKRILTSKPEGTEKIFQRSLLWWLRNYVSDALRVIAEPQGFGQDKTDAVIVTGTGSVVIEIKWLGINETKCQWAHPPRINEGLDQVRSYLNNDSELVKGYLVVYDARPKAQHESLKSYDPQFKHQCCEDPHVLFLDSETPSTSAALNVAASASAIGSAKKP